MRVLIYGVALYHSIFRHLILWAYRGNLDALIHGMTAQQQLDLVTVVYEKIKHAAATAIRVSTQLADLRAIFPQANENSWGQQIRDGAKGASAEGIESRKGAKHCQRWKNCFQSDFNRLNSKKK